MAVTELRVVLQPRQPLWELPLRELEGTAVALIGWVQTGSPVDAGVPEAVAHVLASSLTAAYNVTYPTGDGSGPRRTRQMDSDVGRLEADSSRRYRSAVHA